MLLLLQPPKTLIWTLHVLDTSLGYYMALYIVSDALEGKD
jgi:hypothetical protein